MKTPYHKHAFRQYRSSSRFPTVLHAPIISGTKGCFYKANGGDAGICTAKLEKGFTERRIPQRDICRAMASAQRRPSRAAETMPPAYPAPSPQGYSPSSPGCSSVAGSRGMRTGELVRVSQPMSWAEAPAKPRHLWSNCRSPSRMRQTISPGSSSCRGWDVMPGW